MKRRVIAIAVVVAAVVVACVALWTNEGPLWRAVMLKKVVERQQNNAGLMLYYVPRWSEFPGFNEAVGPCWFKEEDGSIVHYELEHGQVVPGSYMTYWDANGNVFGQGGNGQNRTSPPWLPHPPLIDLREFEE